MLGDPGARPSASLAPYQGHAPLPAWDGFDACVPVALGDSAAPGVDPANYTVTDEELLKRLYGL